MTINSLGIALLFALVGIALFSLAFVIVGKFLPGQLWRQALQEKSIPAAIILAAVAVALGLVISATLH